MFPVSLFEYTVRWRDDLQRTVIPGSIGQRIHTRFILRPCIPKRIALPATCHLSPITCQRIAFGSGFSG